MWALIPQALKTFPPLHSRTVALLLVVAVGSEIGLNVNIRKIEFPEVLQVLQEELEFCHLEEKMNSALMIKYFSHAPSLELLVPRKMTN